jgi:hypothetical protein
MQNIALNNLQWVLIALGAMAVGFMLSRLTKPRTNKKPGGPNGDKS